MAWTLRDFLDVRTQENAPTTGLVSGQTLWYKPSTAAMTQWNGSAWVTYGGTVEALDEEFIDAFQASVRNTQLSVEALLTPTTGYGTTSNATTDRTIGDANDTSVDELADVLATLIADLKAKGVLGA